MPKRPIKIPKSLKDIFRDRLARAHKNKLTKLIRMKTEDSQFSKLDQMVPTPDSIQTHGPEIRSRLLANALAELVNMNGSMQDQIQACQVRIAANNITIKALQDLAESEGLELKFTLQGSPESPIVPFHPESQN